MTVLRLYVLRHGEPARRDVFYGHHDIALSSRGLAQAQAQADALAGIELAAIYTSDLQRAQESARRIAAQGPARPAPVSTPALREMHLGLLEEVEHARALADFPEHAGRRYEDMLDYRIPDAGESVRDVAARVLPFVDALIRRHARAADEGGPASVALVAHNTVNRILLAHAAGLDSAGYVRFQQALGAISRIDVERIESPDNLLACATIAAINWRPRLT